MQNARPILLQGLINEAIINRAFCKTPLLVRHNCLVYYNYKFFLKSQKMPRILALDYGKRRTGIAVTDPLKIIANGLTTVETSKLLDWLKDYVSHESVELFVVGLPTQPDGQPSENQQRVKSFCGELRKALPDIPIAFYDERFTSVLAHRAMIDGGLGQKRRRDKALVDEISACIILQSYMESKAQIF